MPRHSTRSRPYERRRRTRRRRQQRGGNGDQQSLITWFGPAQIIHNAPPPSAIADLRRSDLVLSLGGGPAMINYYPPYLGDILTNIAAGLGDGERILTFAQFASAMSFLEKNDKDFFVFMTELEKDLRIFYQSRIQGITGDISLPNLADPTPTKTPFVLIAYANLPTDAVEPRVPVLGDIKDLPVMTSAPAPAPMVTAVPSLPEQ